MKRDLARLANTEFDVVIIGGGVYGLSAAWDAVRRGLTVAVLEKADWGHAATAGCFKLVHGGLRYLQNLDFIRMRTAIVERRRMMFMAPHLVQPLPFILPCYGHAIRGPEFMWAGLLANDLISADRNAGLDAAHRIPAGRIISAAACADQLPAIRRRGLSGGAQFHDAQMYSAERLCLAFGLSAHDHGAALANYAEVIGFVREAGALRAACVRDQLGGSEFAVRGRLFINMTNAWSEIVIRLAAGQPPERAVLRTKGIQVLTRPFSDRVGFAVETQQKDTTALITRGGRNLFITPWRGLSFMGQTDKLYRGDPDAARITGADVDEFLTEFNRACPGANLARADVRFWVGGLIPVGNDDPNPEVAKFSRKFEILDHAAEGIPNLVSVNGAKYTVCRHAAEKTVNLALRKLGRPHRPSDTGHARLRGGAIADFDAFLRAALAQPMVDEKTTRHLVFSYGTEIERIRAYGRADPDALRHIRGSSEVLRAEVLHAVREEMAQKLADVVMRRTDLGTAGHPGHAALEDCAAIMAAELEWSAERQAREVSETEKLFALE